MSSRPTDEADSLIILRKEERLFGAFVHFLNMIPLWGIVFNAGVWIYFKYRSREVVFQVQQAISFQGVLLILVVIWAVMQILARIVTLLSPPLGDLAVTMNNFFLILVYTAYFVSCLAGIVMVLLGRPFLYPLIGRRVLQGSIGKFSEE